MEKNSGRNQILLRIREICSRIIIGLVVFVSPSIEAQTFFSSKSSGSSARTEIKRWTLQEWLAQKERNRMMDMWLAMNTPSPYEAAVDLAYLSYSQDINGAIPKKEYISYMGKLSAYAKFIGLTGEYENNSQESYSTTAGMINLRLFGNSLQNTSLTFHYGQRTKYAAATATTTESTLRNSFAGATLQLYATKFFGISGHYRDYQETVHETLGKVKGTRTEGGIFIDFDRFRVYGEYFTDVETRIAPNTTAESVTTRTGVQSGFKIFF
jgi:hypothetical protein